jgi:hypothetical protein
MLLRERWSFKYLKMLKRFLSYGMENNIKANLGDIGRVLNMANNNVKIRQQWKIEFNERLRNGGGS